VWVAVWCAGRRRDSGAVRRHVGRVVWRNGRDFEYEPVVRVG
jgi:hypothetical protein